MGNGLSLLNSCYYGKNIYLQINYLVNALFLHSCKPHAILCFGLNHILSSFEITNLAPSN